MVGVSHLTLLATCRSRGRALSPPVHSSLQFRQWAGTPTRDSSPVSHPMRAGGKPKTSLKDFRLANSRVEPIAYPLRDS
jgi:hypothetical protein